MNPKLGCVIQQGYLGANKVEEHSISKIGIRIYCTILSTMCNMASKLALASKLNWLKLATILLLVYSIRLAHL